MNRSEHRRKGQPSANDAGSEPTFDVDKLTLRNMRFETAEASQLFLNLRYLSSAYRGHKDTGVRLPPVSESVSTTAGSGGMVYKAFPHGLMYGDQLSLMAGLGLFVAVIILFLNGMTLLTSGELFFSDLFTTIKSDDVFVMVSSIVLIIVFVVVSPIAILAIASDLVGFRFDTSVLFDRNAGKVHVFSDDALLWAPWRYKLKSYDWQCVRAEIDTVSHVIGPVLRQEAGLRCVILDRRDGKTVVDEFVLGVNMPAHCIQPLLDTWEHVRRFMQREGPLFANCDDHPNPSLGRQPLWKHMVAWPKEHLTGIPELLKSGWQERSPLKIFFGVIGIVTIPMIIFSALWGFLPWMSGLAKRDPTWPAEILASVGGASLHGSDLEAWRGVIPEGTAQVSQSERSKLD